MAGFDRARCRGIEVAEARIVAIDVRQWLAQLARQIYRAEVDLTVRRVEQKLAPPEGRQTSARGGDRFDQGPRRSRERPQIRCGDDRANAECRVLEKCPPSRHAAPPKRCVRSMPSDGVVRAKSRWS